MSDRTPTDSDRQRNLLGDLEELDRLEVANDARYPPFLGPLRIAMCRAAIRRALVAEVEVAKLRRGITAVRRRLDLLVEGVEVCDDD